MDREERLRRTADALVPWYEEHRRSLPWREDPSPYHVWVSEIMLQQTRIGTVIPYYRRFLEEIPDIRSLAQADPERLRKLWEGLGYYSRVRNLQKAAVEILEQHGGEFPRTYEEIRKLRGIGDYTAGAIASICFGEPVPAVDGNVLRVLSRITGDVRPVDAERTKKEVRKELAGVYPEREAGAFTQGIMELGETVCLPNGTPDCGNCPCRGFCAGADGGWRDLPVKAGKKPRRTEEITVFLLRHGGRTALRRRPEKGLLAGMWELPNVAGHAEEREAALLLKEWGCGPVRVRAAGNFRHVFTHVEWEMRCWEAECGEEAPGFLWADQKALDEEISLPTAFRKVLDGCRDGNDKGAEMKEEGIRLELRDEEWPQVPPDHDRVIARAIAVDDDGYYYFVRAERDDEFGRATLIETSGGGVEKGEDPAEGVKRELREELGADAEVLRKIGVVSDYYNLIRRHNINHYYLCRIRSFGEKSLQKDEIEDFHLSTLRLTYEEAEAEYEKRACTPLGRLIANRELPILREARRLLAGSETE